MKPTPANCPRLQSTNPNDPPRPGLPMAKPIYRQSEPMISDSKGRTWVRTGLCSHCDAAIYGLHPPGSRYSHEVCPDTPLHHAIPMATLDKSPA